MQKVLSIFNYLLIVSLITMIANCANREEDKRDSKTQELERPLATKSTPHEEPSQEVERPSANEGMPYKETSQYELNRAINLASNGSYREAIEILQRLTKEKPNWADPHWHLSKTMYWHLNSAKDDPSELHYIVLNRYPDKMADELEKYLELDPNGQYAENARKLLAMLRKTIEESYKSK